jgi:hypothetical protein
MDAHSTEIQQITSEMKCRIETSIKHEKQRV